MGLPASALSRCTRTEVLYQCGCVCENVFGRAKGGGGGGGGAPGVETPQQNDTVMSYLERF